MNDFDDVYHRGPKLEGKKFIPGKTAIQLVAQRGDFPSWIFQYWAIVYIRMLYLWLRTCRMNRVCIVYNGGEIYNFKNWKRTFRLPLSLTWYGSHYHSLLWNKISMWLTRHVCPGPYDKSTRNLFLVRDQLEKALSPIGWTAEKTWYSFRNWNTIMECPSLKSLQGSSLWPFPLPPAVYPTRRTVF